jgi:hypothetical protein
LYKQAAGNRRLLADDALDFGVAIEPVMSIPLNADQLRKRHCFNDLRQHSVAYMGFPFRCRCYSAR